MAYPNNTVVNGINRMWQPRRANKTQSTCPRRQAVDRKKNNVRLLKEYLKMYKPADYAEHPDKMTGVLHMELYIATCLEKMRDDNSFKPEHHLGMGKPKISF